MVGIMAPDLSRSRHQGARTRGKAGAAAVRERVRLSSVGVMRPFLRKLLRARARSVLSRASQRAGACGAERRMWMARPILMPSLGPLDSQHRQRSEKT